MSRQTLKKLVGVMLSLLVLAFGFILFSGINLSHNADTELFADVPNGATALRRFESRRVWVTRLNNDQRRELADIAGFIQDPHAGCHPESLICILLADSLHEGLDLSYTSARPPQIPHDVPWIGGFVDPTTGATFDLLGRAYLQNVGDSRIALLSFKL